MRGEVIVRLSKMIWCDSLWKLNILIDRNASKCVFDSLIGVLVSTLAAFVPPRHSLALCARYATSMLTLRARLRIYVPCEHSLYTLASNAVHRVILVLCCDAIHQLTLALRSRIKMLNTESVSDIVTNERGLFERAPTFDALIPARRLGRSAPSGFALAFLVTSLPQAMCFAFAF